jgi:hypothetical protein
MWKGTSGSVVCSDTMPQTGRSRGRFPMRSLNFSIDLILPVALMALGSTQPLTEMSTRNHPGGDRRPARKADNLNTICGPNVLKMWGGLHVTQSYGPPRPVIGIALLLTYKYAGTYGCDLRRNWGSFCDCCTIITKNENWGSEEITWPPGTEFYADPFSGSAAGMGRRACRHCEGKAQGHFCNSSLRTSQNLINSHLKHLILRQHRMNSVT